jgi:hypothetical protein
VRAWRSRERPTGGAVPGREKGDAKTEYFSYFADGKPGYEFHLPKLVMFVDGWGNAEYGFNLDRSIANIREKPLKTIMELERFKQLRGQATEEFTLSRLQRCGLAELEALYAERRPFTHPTGAYRGVHLAWLETPEARHPVTRPLQHLGFRWAPFGVDFTAQHWFFFDRRFGIGRFVAQTGPSRWRDTETIRLHYDTSRLPRLALSGDRGRQCAAGPR